MKLITYLWCSNWYHMHIESRSWSIAYIPTLWSSYYSYCCEWYSCVGDYLFVLGWDMRKLVMLRTIYTLMIILYDVSLVVFCTANIFWAYSHPCLICCRSCTCNCLTGFQGSYLGDPSYVITSMGDKGPI